eukprot:SAG22_NODE_1719_length_3739_cov_4.655769_2_plen_65_part_00
MLFVRPGNAGDGNVLVAFDRQERLLPLAEEEDEEEEEEEVVAAAAAAAAGERNPRAEHGAGFDF